MNRVGETCETTALRYFGICRMSADLSGPNGIDLP